MRGSQRGSIPFHFPHRSPDDESRPIEAQAFRRAIDVEYKQGSEAEEWELTDLFCLRCGAKNVWRENRKDAGGPDFTVMGVPSHLCLECSASFIGRLAPAEIDELDRQRFEAFRKALAIPGAKPLPKLPC